MTSTKQSGFSLIELLLVLALIGIISAIAIPRYVGARDNARMVGEGEAQCRIMGMQLEEIKGESGLYPPVGTYTWTPSTSTAPASSPVPKFVPPPYSRLSWTLDIPATGSRQTYTITVKDMIKNKNILKRDQYGNAVTFTP